MPFTPITILAGTIDSSDVQDNLDRMKKYVDGTVVVGDLNATAGWCESKHVMRGHYSGIINEHRFASGQQSGRMSTSTEMSFVGNGPTGRGNPTTETAVDFPKTNITFELDGNADVMFQFHACPISPMLDLGSVVIEETDCRMLLDGGVIDDALHTTFRFETTGDTIGQFNASWSGFYVAKNLAAGKHSFGLQGFCKGKYTFLVNWSVSMEAYYL
tara:strand:+ start:232 stop:876 length:645 start_codon:yes stop_codon:yes gene_type:complete